MPTDAYRGRRPARGAKPAATGRKAAPPPWPFPDEPTPFEAELWADLWRRPVAAIWRDQETAPIVIARYVRTVASTPSSTALAVIESALGMTPVSYAKLTGHKLEPADGRPEAPLDDADPRFDVIRRVAEKRGA